MDSTPTVSSSVRPASQNRENRSGTLAFFDHYYIKFSGSIYDLPSLPALPSSSNLSLVFTSFLIT